MSEEPEKPRRSIVLKLEIEADTPDDLASALERFAQHVLRQEVSTSGVSGGYHSGWVYTLSEDKSITREIWIEKLNAYVAWLNSRKKDDV